MSMAGGICFLVLYLLYTRFKRIPIWQKCLMGAGLITSIEFIFGCIFNLVLKMNVWNYSGFSGNFLGQICPQFIMMWGIVSLPIIYLTNVLERRFRL